MTEPLDPELLAKLRQERSAPAPSAARERVAGRLASMLPLAATPTIRARAPIPSSTAGPVTSAATVGMTATAKALLAAAIVASGAAGAGLHATLAPPPPPRIVTIDRPLPAPSPSCEPAPTPTLPPAPALAPAFAPAPALTPAPAPAPQLDAERALLDDARAALTRGEATRSLEDLTRHEKTYPTPMLGEERDALRVEALVKAGRYEEARARADAFRKSAPKSLFLSAVDAAIASIP
jgi:hypothetical protein